MISASGYLTITRGPSKLDLIFALFDNVPGTRRAVQFVTKEAGVIVTSVSSCQRLDGTGQKWRIGGVLQSRKFQGAGSIRYVTAEFNTETRNGTLAYDIPRVKI